MPEARKSNWQLWTTTGLLLLPVLYIASYGPACWICRHAHQHGWYDAGTPAHEFLTTFYAPILWVQFNGPWPVVRILNWYGDFL